MNKITYNRIYCLLLLCMAAAFTLSLPACKKDQDVSLSPPVITDVRNYLPSPNDTSQVTIRDGQWVILIGKNLKGVKEVYFGTTLANLNATFVNDESIVVQIPYIPFTTVPRDKVNEIMVVSEAGTATFNINVTGGPIITHVRNYASAPNDTIVDAVTPGQHVNLIGFNLKGATKIAFQGVNADLTGAVYTDSSVIIKLPTDFSKADATLANTISYSTKVDSSTRYILIYDPELLKYYSDPLYTFLTGGVGKQKTWVLDMNVATGKGTVFNGPMYFSSDDLRWGNVITNNGWGQWQAEWYDWMFPLKDYGTMTFELKGSVVVVPTVKVTQKNLEDAAKNGTFTGSFFMDLNAKTMSFTGATPLNPRRNDLDFSIKAHIISLTEDGLQLGFKHKNKAEFEVLNYVVKK